VLKLIPGIGRVRASEIVEEIYEQAGQLKFDKFIGQGFYDQLQTLREVLQRASEADLPPHEKIAVIQDYYRPLLDRLEADAKDREKDIHVLVALSKTYHGLDRFIQDLSLEPPAKAFQNETSPLVDEEEEDALVLTTAHSAKGLEWRVVFIPHLLDGLFPTARSLRDVFSLEEERRLFYVAATRAKDSLHLSFPHQVSTYEGYFIHPSRFMRHISTTCYGFQEEETEETQE